MTNDNNMNVKAPWIKSLGGIPAHLDYYKGSMYDRVAEVSENFPRSYRLRLHGRKSEVQGLYIQGGQVRQSLWRP